MKSKFLKTFVGLGVFLSFGLLFVQGVSAAGSTTNSSLIPPQIQQMFGLLGPSGAGSADFVTARVRTGLFIALGAIVLVAVVYALWAAFKYIQSQGDPGKIEEAQKAIKAIFMGIAAMLIGIVGIVLVYVFLGSTSVNPNLNQVCLSAPNSLGCAACIRAETDTGTDADRNTCNSCNAEYTQANINNNLTGITADCKDPGS